MKALYAALASALIFGSAAAEEQDVVIYPIFEIVEANQNNIEELLNSPKPVVIDWYAPWCGPCIAFAPIFEATNDAYSATFQFAKINVDQSPELLKRFGIRRFPTLMVIKDGKVIARQEGSLSKAAFENFLTKSLEK